MLCVCGFFSSSVVHERIILTLIAFANNQNNFAQTNAVQRLTMIYVCMIVERSESYRNLCEFFFLFVVSPTEVN